MQAFAEESHEAAVFVELGTGLETAAQAVGLVRAMLRAAAGREVGLITRRGSVGYSIPQLVVLVHEFPELRLCLDFGDLYFGSEALLGSWCDWKRCLTELAPNTVALVPPRGGAERMFRAGGLIEFAMGLLVIYRCRWLKRQLGPTAQVLLRLPE
ncbi:MAG: hypothetical protein ACJAYU_002783 [Bradymonadia bacterium]|jgi:hypothetical protein